MLQPLEGTRRIILAKQAQKTVPKTIGFLRYLALPQPAAAGWWKNANKHTG
jgi:hypothetical protein